MGKGSGISGGETQNGRAVVDKMTKRVLDWQQQCGQKMDPEAARRRAIDIRLRGESRRGQS